MSEVAQMLAQIQNDGVEFIRLQFCDIQGTVKNVAIPVQQAEKALTLGIGFDGSSIEGFCRIEESDMILKPDVSSYAVLPWRGEHTVARFICDVCQPDGTPFEGDPRFVLKKQLACAAELGFSFNTGPELEFFLFKRDANGQPVLEFVDVGGYFDLAPTDLAEDVRRDIVLALTEMGFEIEASHHEVAESQHEIDFKYADALGTADNVVTFRFVTKSIALMNNLHATFMAKPVTGINGNGMHCNSSLFKDGKNAFYDEDAPLQLSETCLQFIAGVLDHIGAITRLANPTINSYKRLVPGYEAPVYRCWSASNRSALIRVPAPRGNSTRVEVRSPDPTCNPYLTFAAILAAGLDGIEKGMKPPASSDINNFDMTEDQRIAAHIETLPDSLVAAHAALLQDELICNALGPHIVDGLTNITSAEWESYRTTVHPWEIDQYFTQF